MVNAHLFDDDNLGDINRSNIQNIKHINYRGAIQFCNYKCSYCPFSMNPYSKRQVEKDIVAFDNFVTFLSTADFKEPITILLTPYGEGLVHEHYYQYMSTISNLENVKAISCQTNLSVNEKKLTDKLKFYQGDLDKIHLWATYHPDMVTFDAFYTKANQLSKQLTLSVGVVGVGENKNKIQALRDNLNSDIYLWINRLDGKGCQYQNDDKIVFKQIDTNFIAEKNAFKASMEKCVAGRESVCIDDHGSIYPCVKNKVKIGDIQSGSLNNQKLTCKAKYCDCFLAYVNRTDYSDLNQCVDRNKKYLRVRC